MGRVPAGVRRGRGAHWCERGAVRGAMVPAEVGGGVVAIGVCGVWPLYLSMGTWSLQGRAGDVVPLGQLSVQSL